METLDENEMHKLAKDVRKCGQIFQACGDPFACVAEFRVSHCVNVILVPCDGTLRECLGFNPIPIAQWFVARLAEGLKACGGEFYDRCPGFERLGQMCDFEPAIEAARRKEQALQDRIRALESKVQELELGKKG
jgi:hypothetical protein